MSIEFNEIGSEFWIESIPETLLTERDGIYCLSGRTAIDLILQDLLKKRSINSVTMPAWCCDSMIAPFVKHGIAVHLYDISNENGLLCYHIESVPTTDVFYLSNFFGYANTLPLEIVKNVKEQGCIILYDRTHSFLMEDSAYREVADYCFASIRKWMGVIGGAVVDGIERPELRECPYVSIKDFAMRDKYRYLMGDKGVSKNEFMAAFGEYGKRLCADYCNYEMDNLSYTLYKQVDQLAMKQQRRENATFIHHNLKGLQFVCEITKDAAPLFVPVLFDTQEQRDNIRRELIKQQIYCPVHWPQPVMVPASYRVNDIVNRELSLLCDQRYSQNAMRRQIETIRQYI